MLGGFSERRVRALGVRPGHSLILGREGLRAKIYRLPESPRNEDLHQSGLHLGKSPRKARGGLRPREVVLDPRISSGRARENGYSRNVPRDVHGCDQAGKTMNIRWDKEPETPELRTLANYLMDHLSIVDRMIGISSRHDLLTLSFTLQPFEQSFFTFEIKRGTFSRAYHIIVWGGLRTGDAMPVLYGKIEDGIQKDETD